MAKQYFTREAYFTNPKGIYFVEKRRLLSQINYNAFVSILLFLVKYSALAECEIMTLGHCEI